MTSFGAVVGPALGSLLVSLGGRRAPGIASATLCLLVSIFAWRFLKESRELRWSAAHAAPAIPVTGRGAIWSVIARSGAPASRLIWIYTIAIGAFYGTAPVIPLLLTERFTQITAKTIGYVVMYLGGMGVVVRALFLGRIVDTLGEARLSRLGLVLLAAGLALAAAARNYPVLWLSLTLMPLGTAFIFPCVTGLLSRVVPSRDRGLYLGVQQTFGGVSRVAFPITALEEIFLMDHFGRSTPFWVSGLMVLGTLALTGAMESYLTPVPTSPLSPLPVGRGEPQSR